jgi:hypothetical protein
MKSCLAILLFFFVTNGDAPAQQSDSSFTLVKTITGDITDFAVDNLGNLYILTSTDQLKKMDANGDSVAVYNNVKKFGKLTMIDVSNPLKVLLYYKDFSTVVALDRLLNVRNTIDLRKQGIFRVSAIGQSYDGKVWLYDELNNKLKKIDEEGKLLLETPDFRQLFDVAPNPQKIFDQDGFVYLYDTAKGFFVFDYYGSLKNRIPITGWSNVKVAGKYIFGLSGNKLQQYELTTFALREQDLPNHFIPYDYINITADKIYTLNKNAISIFMLNRN